MQSILKYLATAFALIVSSALLLTGPSQAQTVVTLYGDATYPPYAYHVKGEPKGIYTEIIRAAAALLDDYEIRIVMVPWKRGLKLMESGEGFALFPPYYHPARRPYIDRYSIPILRERVKVYCHKDVFSEKEPHELIWPEDYFGLVISRNRGFNILGKKGEAAIERGDLISDEADSTAIGLKRAVEGRVDCYANDAISIEWTLYNMMRQGLIAEEQRENIRPLSTVQGFQGYIGYSGPGAANFPFKQDFIEQMDAALREVISSGQAEDIVDKYLLTEVAPGF